MEILSGALSPAWSFVRGIYHVPIQASGWMSARFLQ